MKLVLELPLPPSTNAIWKIGRDKRRGMHLSEVYEAWKREAGGILLASARVSWRGAFHVGDVVVSIDLDQTLRSKRGDCDNRAKAALDFLQYAGVITDDKQVRRVSIGWEDTGGVPCRISLARSVAILDGPATIHVTDPRRAAA
jgi:Holliday junction resolvase RusA-like endonuclease